ncbi:MAG: hypothetical protein IKM31_05645 [Oscillospiraceae bacterium]|nr:hypothetical protein [Oscillospiraceae bacterium]
MFDIRETTERFLKGCVIPAENGVRLYTPDGKGAYAALWTRDFAYMVEYAADLLDGEDIRRAIQLIIDHPDENGWIADRIDIAGEGIYTAGDENFPALPNLDNGCFLCLCADHYLKTLPAAEACAQFLLWQDTLCRGIDCLPKDPDGFILNETVPAHSPYGFTDTVCKTGLLCFETLLLWRAMKALCGWFAACGQPCARYERRCTAIEKKLFDVFCGENGMLRASTGLCAQIDIWASCFAVSAGFPMSIEQQSRIAVWMAGHYDDVVQDGQLRHLPAGEYWERTFIDVEKGTYQNGAFWATPFVWLYDTLSVGSPALARRALSDILCYFERHGVFECVNGSYRQLDTYVASAAAVYSVCKRLGMA